MPSRSALPLRFLLCCLGGWALLRVVMTCYPATGLSPHGAARPSLAPAPLGLITAGAAVPRPTVHRVIPALPVAAVALRRAGIPAAAGRIGGGRLRPAAMARILSSSGSQAAAPPTPPARPARGGWSVAPPFAGSALDREGPFGMPRRQLAGWSLGSWLYVRGVSVAGAGDIGATSQLGASQGGLRIAYGFGETGRLRAYGRATLALRNPRQRELAYGLAFAPRTRWPVDIAIERRLAVGPEGRTAFAAMVTGGVSGVALPGDFRLDGYGQAGVVGVRRRDGFIDGAVVIDRRLGADEDAPLRLGLLAAGGVQPGAARIDVGPRLTLRLPDVGKGSRIAIDWRQRIAGHSDPGSGVALTLASDF